MFERLAEFFIHEPRERAWRKVKAAEDQAEALKRIADRVGEIAQPTLYAENDYQYIEDAPQDGTLLRLRFEGDEQEYTGSFDGEKWIDREQQTFPVAPNFFAFPPPYSAAEIAKEIVTRWLEFTEPHLEITDEQSDALQRLIVVTITKAAQ
jgi:hypothetical protein